MLLSGNKILKIYFPTVKRQPVNKPPEIAALHVGRPFVKYLKSIVNQVVTMTTKTNWLMIEVKTNPKEGAPSFR